MYVKLSLQLGTKPDMQLDLLFLIIPEQLPYPIIGLNGVKFVADSHPECSLVNMFPSEIVNKNKDQIKFFAEV